MRRRIRKDHERFKRIVKGKIREDLKDLVSRGYLRGKEGSKTVKVPLKGIDIPEFRYDPRSAGGIGSGEGEPGDVVEGGDRGPEIQPGAGPGTHFPEVEIDVEELAQIMGEKLELPHIEPKGEELTIKKGHSYRETSRFGPETLLRKKRSFKRGLIRKALLNAGEEPDFKEPIPAPPKPKATTIPIKEDKKYLYPGNQKKREARAVIIFMRDMSGSMTGEKTEIIRQENYLIDVWLQSHYDNLERVYLVHDYNAAEVTEDKFYQLSTSGGTRISSVYKLCLQKIKKQYPPETWNIYPFHFSDGENFSKDTSEVCVPLLADELLPCINQFCYGQVSLGNRAAGKHIKAFKAVFEDEDNLVTSIIPDRDHILDSIENFLGAGR